MAVDVILFFNMVYGLKVYLLLLFFFTPGLVVSVKVKVPYVSDAKNSFHVRCDSKHQMGTH